MSAPAIAIVLASLAAPTDELELRWSAPPGCPQVDEVRTRLRGYLGDEREPSSHRVEGTVVAEDGGWRLDLVIDGELRELRSHDCNALADAAAMVTSLAMDAEPPTPTPTPTPTPIPTPSPTEPTPRRVDAIGHLGPLVRIDGGLYYGTVPLAPDAALTLGWSWSDVRVEVRGTFVAPGRTPARGVDRLRVFQGSIGPRGCYVARFGRFELPLCAGLEIGAQRVEVRPARRTAARHVPWAGLGAGAAWVWPVHRNVALWFGVDAIIAVARGRLALPSGATWRPGPAALRGAVGIEARWAAPRRRGAKIR